MPEISLIRILILVPNVTNRLRILSQRFKILKLTLQKTTGFLLNFLNSKTEFRMKLSEPLSHFVHWFEHCYSWRQHITIYW